MTDKDFRLVAILFMVSDPCPLSDEERKRMEEFLDREAKERGWKDWIGMFHYEAKVRAGIAR